MVLFLKIIGIMLESRLIKKLTYILFIVWAIQAQANTPTPSKTTSPKPGVLEERELTQGLKYLKQKTSAEQVIHILQANPTLLQIKAAHANEQATGRATVTEIAQKYQAIAAVNGGYFKIGDSIDGLPAGVLKIRNQWYSIAYSSRAAIGWSNSANSSGSSRDSRNSHSAVHSNGLIDRIQTKTRLLINHQKFPVHGVNQPASQKKAILYTDAFGSTLDNPDQNYHLVIANNQITDIKTSGSTKIPKGGYVYCVGAKTRILKRSVKINEPAFVNIEVLPAHKDHYQQWQTVDNIVGGTPLLLYRHKVIRDKTTENKQSTFLMQRHARTAVGLLSNGHWVFVVVEQSPLSGSPGMTIPELAHFMEKLNCESALNLDGGGSSTLYIKDKVVNNPKGDKDEDLGLHTIRAVSDAILIVPK